MANAKNMDKRFSIVRGADYVKVQNHGDDIVRIDLSEIPVHTQNQILIDWLALRASQKTATSATDPRPESKTCDILVDFFTRLKAGIFKVATTRTSKRQVAIDKMVENGLDVEKATEIADALFPKPKPKLGESN